MSPPRSSCARWTSWRSFRDRRFELIWSGAPGASVCLVWRARRVCLVWRARRVCPVWRAGFRQNFEFTSDSHNRYGENFATYFVHIWGGIQQNSKTNLGAVCAKLTPRPSWVCVENHVDPGTPSMWAYVPAEGSSTRDPRRHLNRSRCRDRSVVSTR